MRSDFRVGTVISQSLEIWALNIVTFVIIYLVSYVPTFSLGIYLGIAYGSVDEWTLDILAGLSGGYVIALLLFVFLEFALGAFVIGAIAFGAIHALRGSRPSLGDCIRGGLSSLLPAAVVYLLFAIFMGLGAVLLLIPMFFVLVIYAVCIPVAAIEGRGILESFSRSAALTKGNRWRIFGLIIIYCLFALAVELIIELISYVTGGGGIFLSFVLSPITQIAIGSFSVIALGVTYHNLRLENEGMDIIKVAAVFD